MSDHGKSIKGLAAVVFAFVVISGCGGGGGSGDSGSTPPDTPIAENPVTITPEQHDFGVITFGNQPAPATFRITNTGAAAVEIREIRLSDDTGFALHLSGEADACTTTAPTLPAGSSCTVEVEFQPEEAGNFAARLTVTPADPSAAPTDAPISGTYEALTALNVRINQAETDGLCPSPEVTAYVSVTDQGGYPVRDLAADQFSLFEDMMPVVLSRPPAFVSQVNTPISISLAMDYSRSITDTPAFVADMESAVSDFVNQLGPSDEAEIIKFGTEVEVFQPFTSDKTLLITAVQTPWTKGGKTNLYDAVWQAVTDTAARPNPRKAVIAITDGENRGEQTKYSLNAVIQHAQDQKVPVFTIALGIFDSSILERIADSTGGRFFSATTSANLKNTYQQLVDTLLENQYILSYVSGAAGGAEAELRIEASSPSATGMDARNIVPCP